MRQILAGNTDHAAEQRLLLQILLIVGIIVGVVMLILVRAACSVHTYLHERRL